MFPGYVLTPFVAPKWFKSNSSMCLGNAKSGACAVGAKMTKPKKLETRHSASTAVVVACVIDTLSELDQSFKSRLIKRLEAASKLPGRRRAKSA